MRQHANSNGESFLSVLIHHLIARLPLTEAQVTLSQDYLPYCIQIELDREEEEAEDCGAKEISFKPIHYRSRATTSREDDEENGGEETSEDVSSLWTVRKEAARVLDIVSCAIPAEITLSLALPILQNNLSSSNVWYIEAGYPDIFQDNSIPRNFGIGYS